MGANTADESVSRTAGAAAEYTSAHSLTTPPIGSFAKVQHVVMLMMENRAYDNYFGAYCLTTGTHCRSATLGLSPTLCVPLFPSNPSAGCVRPYDYNLTPSTEQGLPDLIHTWAASHNAYANGSMMGFYVAEQQRNYTFGHYNGSTIPVYWDIAEEFGLADDFFSSTLTYSLPNHWYLVAGQSPSSTMGPNYPVYSNISADKLYLSQANATPSIEGELLNHPSVSWAYYDYNLSSYSHAIHDLSGTDGGSAFQLWNPLAAVNTSYTGSVPSHFRDRASFFSDLTSGQLPNVSYVIPNGSFSDHLPSNITSGEDYVASVVNAVEASPYWNSTAVFVSWDEYGGWYDHLAPSQVDANGYGFRVPLLVVSPWTSPGFVSARTLSFDSLLHFVEWRWGLGCLTNRDCNATLPTGFFNFALHRAPTYFADANNSVYPYVAPPAGPPFIEGAALVDAPGRSLPAADLAGVDWS